MKNQDPVKVSFPFYPSDLRLLSDRVSGLKQAGVKVRDATVLRALIYLTTPAEMFLHASRLASSYLEKDGPRESETVVARPTVDLPPDQIEKLDAAVDQLAEKKIINASRPFIVRAILRASPDAKTLAPRVQAFLEMFPNKPRGLSALRLARKKRHG